MYKFEQNQLDYIKTDIQRHHLLIIIWLVRKVNLSRLYRSFQPTVVFVRNIHHQSVSYICVFEVFSVSHQRCDDCESHFMMFREDSQINFAN